MGNVDPQPTLLPRHRGPFVIRSLYYPSFQRNVMVFMGLIVSLPCSKRNSKFELPPAIWYSLQAQTLFFFQHTIWYYSAVFVNISEVPLLRFQTKNFLRISCLTMRSDFQCVSCVIHFNLIIRTYWMKINVNFQYGSLSTEFVLSVLSGYYSYQFGGDRLCGLVVRVLGYRYGGPGSIPGTTRKNK
jgi:hypothetical protein